MLSTWNAAQRRKQPWYGESMCKCVAGNGKRQGGGDSQYCPQAAPYLSAYFFLCLSRMAPLCISTPDTLERMCRTRSKMSRDVMAGCMRVVCVRVSECQRGSAPAACQAGNNTSQVPKRRCQTMRLLAPLPWLIMGLW